MPKAAPTHGRAVSSKKQHQPTLRKKEPNRGKTKERGYDGSWRKLRATKLANDPLCELCLPNLTPATEVDHITPIRERPDLRLEWTNLQSICRPCHNEKTRAESSRNKQGQARPEWLPEPSIPVTLVCGPPASGKSTYAYAHAKGSDEVLDLDVIACRISGVSGHRWPRRFLGPALYERNRRIADWSRAERGMGWLIVMAPTITERDWWREKLGAEIVVLETSANECAERAKKDERLTPRMRHLIGRWWEQYERSPLDQIVSG